MDALTLDPKPYQNTPPLPSTGLFLLEVHALKKEKDCAPPEMLNRRTPTLRTPKITLNPDP